MPITVADTLRASGMTDEQINGLDANVRAAFDKVASEANQTLDQAELARRANQDLYEKQIAPALDGWGSEKANLEATAAYYKTLAEKAKEGGFIPADTPFTPAVPAARAANGQYVAGGNPVPGSPGVDMNQLEQNLGMAFGTISDLQWKYQTLYGSHMPDSPSALMKEAQAQRLPLMDYAARKYNFPAKQQEQETKKQKDHDDAIRAEVTAAKDREFAERSNGSNPNLVSPPGSSSYAQVRKAVTEGQRKDPLTLSREERRSSTRSAIHQEIAENAVA